ncbi:MAG: replicative helicase [Candidatus Dependentiae bacterium]|nr:replicative helicase [Candidatus Dependentiae bacterium]
MTLTSPRKYASKESGQPDLLFGRALPSSVEAERAVLSAILLNNESLTLITDTLAAADFYHRPHRLMYQVLVDLAGQGRQLDLITVQDALAARQQLEEVGGMAFLLELQEDLPSLGLVEQHGRIIKEKAILRQLINSASSTIKDCYDQGDATLDEILDKAEKNIFSIAHKVAKPNFVQLNVLLKQTFHRLANTKISHNGVTGIPTGFSKFDSMTSGFQKGDLIILAARPSMGKTALMLNMAVTAAKEGCKIGIFSLEMSAEQLLLRMLSSESHIAHQKIRNATISSDEWVALTNTAAHLAETKIYVDDTPSLTIRDLRSKARKLKAQGELDMIIIDYLQLLSGGGQFENRTQEISSISRALKALAKELEVPVIAGSQLSRSLEGRMDKRPLLSDLRESGAIEQDGDLIFFLYRDVVYNPDAEHPNLTEIIIGKQRNGPIGTCYATFSGEITRFDDLPE